MGNLREQLALASGFAAYAPHEALARARYVEAAARQSMEALGDERGELQSIAAYAARKAQDYEQLLEQHRQEVRARERLYRERERAALELPLPPKPWSMPHAYREQAGRTAVSRYERERPAETTVVPVDSELAKAF